MTTLREKLDDLLRFFPRDDSVSMADSALVNRAREALEEARRVAGWHPKRSGVAHIWDPVRRQIKASAKEKRLPATVKRTLAAALRAIDSFHPETALPKKARGPAIDDATATLLRRVLNVENDATYGHGLDNHRHVEAVFSRIMNDPLRHAATTAGFMRTLNKFPRFTLTPKRREALRSHGVAR